MKQHQEERESIEVENCNRARELLRLPLSDLITLLGNQGREGESPPTAASSTTSSSRQPIRVFLSYARPDREAVGRLFDQLYADGFQPWMDIRCIHPGQKWPTAIENAIRESHFFILCLSPHSANRRGFLQREIRMALDKLRELLDEDIYFVPLRLEPCELPASLSEYQALDLSEPGAYDRLVSAFREGYRLRFPAVEGI